MTHCTAFAQRHILTEKTIRLDHIAGTIDRRQYFARGWFPLLSIEGPTDEQIVHKFHVNLESVPGQDVDIFMPMMEHMDHHDQFLKCLWTHQQHLETDLRSVSQDVDDLFTTENDTDVDGDRSADGYATK
ncbi:hypothetical protein F0562_032514 [Nyssa sinensis]|uniref:Uncharacterized protein n=1 Tax=Nyssa sinensis TaxID=561372 RepID=A0A5J5ARM1_9ASTE|nr:hypothetical protein F0562_032514 [Nyssa sinensis]